MKRFLFFLFSWSQLAAKCIVPLSSKWDEAQLTQVQRLIEERKVHGVIFMGGTLEKQLDWIARLGPNVLICQDAEWGPGMRLADQTSFPKNMTLGAIVDEDLLYQAGRGIARECLRAGIHMNFAPVLDVNTNPDNPVIGMRALGDDPKAVARKGALLIKGMRSEGLLTCGKHFPGHGDTTVNTHKELATIDQMELLPFKRAIEAGVDGIMIGHLHMPEIDEKPASLSRVFVQKILREELGFQGLVFPDSLSMEALSGNFPEIVKQAREVGYDYLLFSDWEEEKIAKILDFAETLPPEETAFSIPVRVPKKGGEESLKRELFRAALTSVGRPLEKSRLIEVSTSGVDVKEDEGIILFGSPYLLAHYPGVDALVAYEDNQWTREVVQEAIEGRFVPSGKLPIQLR